MVGQTISHYKIIEKLGAGGMGKVYLAEDLQLKRQVALKFLPSELIRDEQTRSRFVHEAQAASALDHPNIGTVYEINENEENPFIAMAYYAGGTLSEKIAKKSLTFEQTITITIHLAEGLQKAHSKDIVHRDIKPANILFSEEDEPKIIDFGLAKFLNQSLITRTGTTVGTLAYMSPEQAQGKEVDHRTDIWAMGVILYEILSGERPFKGEYDQAIMYSIVNEDPEFITKIRNDIPIALEQIVDKALNKNPDKRFQSMEDFCEALKSALDEMQSGKSVTASAFRLGKKQRKMVFRLTPAILLPIIVVAYFMFFKDALSSPVSMVILPLENISRDAEQEWFTESMTDELITDLARMSGLRIIARKSAMSYKNSDKSSSEIGSELGVSYIVQGSILKMDDKVKFNIHLIDASSDEILWANRYEHELKDILTLQGEVALAIAKEIKVNLTPAEESSFTNRGVVNPKAFEAYLNGRHHVYKLTRQGLDSAFYYFTLATELDPEYAPAYAGISFSWAARAQMGYMLPKEASEKARPAKEKALELDNTLPETHYLMAVTATWGDWDWERARKSFETTIRLNPNMAEARAYYSHFLFFLNRGQEAMREIELALKLDPHNPLYHGLYGMDLNYAHRYDEAIELLDESLRLNPGTPILLTTLRTTYHQNKMYKKAIESWRQSFQTSGNQKSLDALNSGYIEGGYHMALRRVAELKINQSKSKYIPPWQIGTLYTRAAMPDEALDYLEKAVEDHDPNSPYLSVDPIFDYMREMPRFKSLIRKIGLGT
jgi:serine/threonine protein kinase/Tfp pilus assembly protein PilF